MSMRWHNTIAQHQHILYHVARDNNRTRQKPNRVLLIRSDDEQLLTILLQEANDIRIHEIYRILSPEEIHVSVIMDIFREDNIVPQLGNRSVDVFRAN